MASSSFVCVEWLRPKRYFGFREKIARSRIRGKIEAGEEVRALWRGKLYRVKIVDEHGYDWEDGDDEPLAAVKGATNGSRPEISPTSPLPPTPILPSLPPSPSSTSQPTHSPLVHSPPPPPSPQLPTPILPSLPPSPSALPSSTSQTTHPPLVQSPPPPPLPQPPTQILPSLPPSPSPLSPSAPSPSLPPQVQSPPPPPSPLPPTQTYQSPTPFQMTPLLPPPAQRPFFQASFELSPPPRLPVLTPPAMSHPVTNPASPHVTMEYVKKLEERIKYLEDIVFAQNRPKGGKANYRLVNGQAVLGSEGGPQVSVDPEVYENVWARSKSGKDLVLKLMPVVLSEDIMANSNFFGGAVFTGRVWVKKFQLRTYPPFVAIVGQAGIEFPGCFSSESERKNLREVVNAKCRKIGSRRRDV